MFLNNAIAQAQRLVMIVPDERRGDITWLAQGLQKANHHVLPFVYTPDSFKIGLTTALHERHFPVAILTTPRAMKKVLDDLIQAHEEVFGGSDGPINRPLPAIGLFGDEPEAINKANADLCRSELFSALEIKEPASAASIYAALSGSAQWSNPELHFKM